MREAVIRKRTLHAPNQSIPEGTFNIMLEYLRIPCCVHPISCKRDERQLQKQQCHTLFRPKGPSSTPTERKLLDQVSTVPNGDNLQGAYQERSPRHSLVGIATPDDQKKYEAKRNAAVFLHCLQPPIRRQGLLSTRRSCTLLSRRPTGRIEKR